MFILFCQKVTKGIYDIVYMFQAVTQQLINELKWQHGILYLKFEFLISPLIKNKRIVCVTTLYVPNEFWVAMIFLDALLKFFRKKIIRSLKFKINQIVLTFITDFDEIQLCIARKIHNFQLNKNFNRNLEFQFLDCFEAICTGKW